MTPKSTVSLAALSVALIAFGATLSAHAATDTDGDGIPDKAEALLGTDPLVADTNGNGVSDKAEPKPLEMASPLPQNGKAGGIAIKVPVRPRPQVRVARVQAASWSGEV